MTLPFEKFHGTGNDFILMDNTSGKISLTVEQITLLCHRRFGIGADGLILIQKKEGVDFEMIYFNADGGKGTMCGNGGRCAVIYAQKLGLCGNEVRFLAADGIHEATVTGNGVKLSMSNVSGVTKSGDAFVLNTGSPHYVTFVDDVESIDVVSLGKGIRNSPEYKAEGINVNFVAMKNGQLQMRTYERGVEDETLSCGTGTVAVAIAASLLSNPYAEGSEEWLIGAPGGKLSISFYRRNQDFSGVFLHGPATFVFSGAAMV